MRRSLIKKMDHLERMIQTAEAPYRKKRCYYAQLDHEIKKSVTTYVDSISKDTLTAIEKLDIKEFNKSRKVNGMFSTFARGKLQRKLMEALNQKGCDFFEVAPDFTSQVCPVCSNLNAESRHSKGFCCTSCGYQDDADHVGAVNIRKRAGDREILELCKEHQYSHKNLQNAIRIQKDSAVPAAGIMMMQTTLVLSISETGQVIEKYWNCVRNTNTVTRIYRMRFESYMKNGMSHIKQNKQHLHESRRDPVTSYMML